MNYYYMDNDEEIYYRFNGGARSISEEPTFRELKYLQYHMAPHDVVNILSDPEIDAEKLGNALFPVPHRVIFISHFREDIDRVGSIKRKIERNTKGKLQCFVDSDVWENVSAAIDLLAYKNAILPDRELYDREEYDHIAKNMYMILSMALQKAIHECCLFVFIPPIKSTIGLNGIFETHSPWVWQELYSSSLFLEYKGVLQENFPETGKRAHYITKFNYSAPLEHLTKTHLSQLIDMLSTMC